MKTSAREVALRTLTACDQQGAWSDLALKKNLRDGELDSRDAALATRLSFGVLQNRMLIDFYIESFSSIPLTKIEHHVLNTLRLGVYQMAFLTKIPVSAAVNESVALARSHSKNPRSPALVNGILRAVARNLEKLPRIDEKDPLQCLSIRYSHPLWLVRTFADALNLSSVEALLALNNGEPPTTAQVNTVQTDQTSVLASLRSQGAEAEPHPWLPNCITLTGGGELDGLRSFQNGDIYIQDVSSRLAVLAAGLEPGMRVLDACAAPGGKSCAAAIAMGDRGEVVSCDIHPHKQKLIEAAAARLKLGCISAQVQDAKVCRPDFTAAFDLVIADVPCSGLGIIRKKPDIRYKDPLPLEGLPKVQGDILENVSAYVKPGGALLYCTCTLLERENESVVDAFLAQHPAFALEGFTLPDPVGAAKSGSLTLWPQVHGTDGFFIAKLRRAH